MLFYNQQPYEMMPLGGGAKVTTFTWLRQHALVSMIGLFCSFALCFYSLCQYCNFGPWPTHKGLMPFSFCEATHKGSLASRGHGETNVKDSKVSNNSVNVSWVKMLDPWEMLCGCMRPSLCACVCIRIS